MIASYSLSCPNFWSLNQKTTIVTYLICYFNQFSFITSNQCFFYLVFFSLNLSQLFIICTLHNYPRNSCTKLIFEFLWSCVGILNCIMEYSSSQNLMVNYSSSCEYVSYFDRMIDIRNITCIFSPLILMFDGSKNKWFCKYLHF